MYVVGKDLLYEVKGKIENKSKVNELRKGAGHAE